MAKCQHRKSGSVTLEVQLCGDRTWRSSAPGTWEVSSMPGLVCRAGWGRRQAARYCRGLVPAFVNPSFDELKSVVTGLAERPTSCTSASSAFLRAT